MKQYNTRFKDLPLYTRFEVPPYLYFDGPRVFTKTVNFPNTAPGRPFDVDRDLCPICDCPFHLNAIDDEGTRPHLCPNDLVEVLAYPAPATASPLRACHICGEETRERRADGRPYCGCRLHYAIAGQIIRQARRQYGKPWRDDEESKRAVAQYLLEDDPSYLGNFDGRLVDELYREVYLHVRRLGHRPEVGLDIFGLRLEESRRILEGEGIGIYPQDDGRFVTVCNGRATYNVERASIIGQADTVLASWSGRLPLAIADIVDPLEVDDDGQGLVLVEQGQPITNGQYKRANLSI